MNVIHVGASELEELETYINKGVRDVVYIEAIPYLIAPGEQKLKAVNDKLGTNYKLLQGLMWNTTGETKTLKLFNNHTFGSVFGINQEQWRWPNIKDVGTYDQVLTTITLDDLLANNQINPADYSYLVIDTQGAEYEVLQGATKLLPYIKCIQFECSVREIYKGQKVYEDVKNLLVQKGFIVDIPSMVHCDVYAYRAGFKEACITMHQT